MLATERSMVEVEGILNSCGLLNCDGYLNTDSHSKLPILSALQPKTHKISLLVVCIKLHDARNFPLRF